MNTRSGYVIDDTADLQSTRHLTQATSCRTIYRMPFVRAEIGTSTRPILQHHRGIPALRPATHTSLRGGSGLRSPLCSSSRT